MDGAMKMQKFTKHAGYQDIGTYWKSATNYNELLAHVRSLKYDGLFKQSNEGNESGFEQSFSSLAYAYMKDKAPRLLDFLVGFQLVDRNDDNTKAMGLFGFKVGEQWLYAPTFFLNGDLKGHELLYIKKQDSFVPMKENWVNYLMARKPHVLGEGSPQSTFQLGGREPDFSSMTQSPSYGFGKRGMDDWAKPALPLIAALMTKQANVLYSSAKPHTKLAFAAVVREPLPAAYAEVAAKFDLNRVLADNLPFLKTAFELAQSSPHIKRGFDLFYGRDCFSRWGREIKTAAVRSQHNIMPSVTKQAAAPTVYAGPNSLIPEPILPQHPVHRGALSVYTKEAFAVLKNGEQLDETGEEQLTTDDRTELQSNGYLVKDERKGEEISKAYDVQIEQKLQNPDDTSLYEVLEKPGVFSRMLVISHPYSNSGQHNFMTVIRLQDSSKGWVNAHRTQIWANQIEERKEFEDWWNTLGDKDSLQTKGLYVAIDKNGSATVPFEVAENYGDGAYKVNFKAHCSQAYDRVSGLPSIDHEHHRCSDDYVSSHGAKLVVNAENKQGTKLKAIQGELRVPGNFKFIKLKDPPKPKKYSEGCCVISIMSSSSAFYGTGSEETGSDPRPIQLGRLEDIQLLFHEKTARLKIYNDHNEVSISSPLGTQRLQKQAAYFSLIRDHGFTAHVAGCMLKQAETKTQKVFRVKYAPGFGSMIKAAMPNYGALAGGPSAPAFPEPQMGMESYGGRNAVNSMYPDEQTMGVPEMDSSKGDPSQHDIWQNYTHEDFQNTMGQAQQASQSGQKEVFDTAMIGGMLKAVRQDSLVDRYLGDLMKALDKLGRILFMFYWHQEEFEDRYGKQDLPELEDSLRNAFEVLGDVVLFLKEKTVENDFGDLGEVNIEEAARN